MNEAVEVPCSLFLSEFSSRDGICCAVVSKQTERNKRTQPMRVVSRLLEADAACPFEMGAKSRPRVRTIASTTEDLLAPAISDFRPRNVSNMNTL